ncbi:MAG: hypothetical protein JNJ71_14875 [Rubrivivax sp.]|nr:hypothetical protein [Rubrivivax sp.]
MPLIRSLATLAAALITIVTGRAAAAPADTLRVSHGPFLIVAQARRVSSGAFPNTSGNPFATMEVTAFSLRWRDREVVVPGVGKRFFRVLRLSDAPRPAVLVATSDFHLVSEEGGELRITRFGQPSTDLAQAQWLDALGGQPGPVMIYGSEKISDERDTQLTGGRWLRLATHTVLDVRTLRAYPVEHWVPARAGQPGFNAGNSDAGAFSPGQTQFVAPGEADSDDAQGRRPDALVVTDIPSGKSQALVLDRRRTPYADFSDITGAWVSHYFRWERPATGREALVPRTGVKPLPWKGRLISFGDRQEYRVPRIDPAFVGVVRRIAIDSLGARAVPDRPGAPADGNTLTVPGCDHLIALSATPEHVGVYAPQPAQPPWVRCQATVLKLGALVDAELASGRHDRLIRLD